MIGSVHLISCHNNARLLFVHTGGRGGLLDQFIL
jgi:hypothetical protein